MTRTKQSRARATRWKARMRRFNRAERAAMLTFESELIDLYPHEPAKEDA